MAEYAKRPEVTVSTMGKVHNPTGLGVQVKAKLNKISATNSTTSPTASDPAPPADPHATKVKEGTAKRNITRKKTAEKDSGNYNSCHKKQGGHGKGQWKADVIEDYTADPTAILDKKDPLYDEHDGQTPFVLTSNGTTTEAAHGYDPHTTRAVYGPLLTCAEFKVQVAAALQEYFDACDAAEVVRTLTELGCPEYHQEIIKKAVSLAMDKGPRERELTSQLFPQLLGGIVKDMEEGFEILLDGLDELSTDVPEAKTMAASFLARAVVDEVLPPAFLSEQNNNRPGDPVIEKAISLLSREHCNARLERVWGPGDGRPVEELKMDMDQLLQEYLLSRELDEAARCVEELNAPHFHHELVKRGVVAAMEMNGDMDAMAALFGFLVSNAIVSEGQVAKGVQRLHAILPDIMLDVPTAPALLTSFEDLAAQQGCLGSSNGESKETKEGE